MTPRERYLATLNHVKPDQVPIELGCRPEIMEQLRRHYKVEDDGDVARILGADNGRYIFVNARWREFERKINDGPGGRRIIRHDARTTEDQWGVVQRTGTDGKYEEWIDGPFVHTDDIDSFPWPDESDITIDPSMAARAAEFKRQGYWVMAGGGVHPFKQAWHMRGFENFLCDYIANPEWVEKLYERFVNFAVAHCRLLAAAGVDMIEYWGDVAMQDRMIVPPEQWRRLDKPAWRRIIAETRKVNPEVRFFFHSDGDVSPIIPDIIEIGFDILNPIQPECVNPGLLKQRWGDRITLDGGGSIQRTLPRGTLDDVRREVDFLMMTCAYNGGYILRASNVVPYDTPLQNVITFYEMARDYDLSKLQGPPRHIPDPPPCMSITTFGRVDERLD